VVTRLLANAKASRDENKSRSPEETHRGGMAHDNSSALKKKATRLYAVWRRPNGGRLYGQEREEIKKLET